MSLQTITGKRVGDTYYKLEHPSGLTVFIYPKENNDSTYAVFGAKYGSVYNYLPSTKTRSVQYSTGGYCALFGA